MKRLLIILFLLITVSREECWADQYHRASCDSPIPPGMMLFSEDRELK